MRNSVKIYFPAIKYMSLSILPTIVKTMKNQQAINERSISPFAVRTKGKIDRSDGTRQSVLENSAMKIADADVNSQ